MTKDVQIWVRVTPDLKAWLKQQAEAEGRTLSNYTAHELSKIRNKNGIKKNELQTQQEELYRRLMMGNINPIITKGEENE